MPALEQRFRFFSAPLTRSDFAADVRAGLAATPKELPPRYFYDALGSVLFDAICHLPEYYVTRAESEILQTRAEAIVAAFGDQVRLVELGSGSASKTRLLIDAVLRRQERVEFLPIDVDAAVLQASAHTLLSAYPSLSVTAICAAFDDEEAPIPEPAGQRTIVLFLGSTIGNLDRAGAIRLLNIWRRRLRQGDRFFLGADLRKDRRILVEAYDDPLGVTASFNKNLLLRMNRELGAHFDLMSFDHHARFNEEKSRIEMHLISRKKQSVGIDALNIEIPFEEGESIHTENSYKYDQEMLESIVGEAGYAIDHQWTDSRGWFTDLLLKPL